VGLQLFACRKCGFESRQGCWKFISCECCVLSGTGLSVGLFTRPEESYRIWGVWVCSWSLDNEEALTHYYKALAPKKKKWGTLIYCKYRRVINVLQKLPLFNSNLTFSTKFLKYASLEDKRENFTFRLLILPLFVVCLSVTVETLIQKCAVLGNKADIILRRHCFQWNITEVSRRHLLFCFSGDQESWRSLLGYRWLQYCSWCIVLLPVTLKKMNRGHALQQIQ